MSRQRITNLLQSLEGRKNPSVSKIHYVTYLEDCQKASALAISHAITLLRSISTTTEGRHSGADFEFKLKEWCLTIETDLEYLLNRHSDVAIEITNLRKKVKQRDLLWFGKFFLTILRSERTLNYDKFA